MAKDKANMQEIVRGNPFLMGVTTQEEGLNFTLFAREKTECRLHLFHQDTGKLIASYDITQNHKVGDLFTVFIKYDKKGTYTYRKYSILELSYLYEVEGKPYLDPYAPLVYGRETYGKVLSREEKNQVRGGFPKELENTWVYSRTPIPANELIIYKLHLRGFTKHDSSHVKEKGTFLGLTKKIQYFKDLGINCIQLMPIYEYNEIIETKNPRSPHKVNYWGYSGDNQYFSPKTSYAYEPKNAVEELKTMVEQFHQEGIEIILEMNFTVETPYEMIRDCLRHWVFTYGIDGFVLSSGAVPLSILVMDPILGHTKILADQWKVEEIQHKTGMKSFENLYEYRRDFSNSMKRFIRGDEEQIGAVIHHIKNNPSNLKVVNYITNHDGFNLMDHFTYDYKHNEENGENNQDGTVYNYSWNCGVEGVTKKLSILKLRQRQIRNAFVLLFFSQGTPLIFAGDEFCFSQNGNNNPYCHDNETTWINWDLLDDNKEMASFVKELIHLRKSHPILHKEEAFLCRDYISCGYPDLSFHGTRAWYPEYVHYNRMLGVMFSGCYAKIRREDDQSFYLCMNMHWEKHSFDLPFLPKDRKWCLYLDTKDGVVNEELLVPLSNQRTLQIDKRTIVILIGNKMGELSE